MDESPPPLVTFLNGLHHVGLIAISLIYPLLVFRGIDTPTPLVTNLFAIGLMVIGLGPFCRRSARVRLGRVGLYESVDAHAATTAGARVRSRSTQVSTNSTTTCACLTTETRWNFRQRLSNKEIVARENGVRLLAGFMLRRCADRLRSQFRTGSASVLLHYDH